MNVLFYRYMIGCDEHVLKANYPNVEFKDCVVDELRDEIAEQDKELAELLKFGKIDLTTEPYTIEATLDMEIDPERFVKVFEAGVSGNFEITNTD